MNTYFRHPSKMMSRGSIVRQESSLTGSGSEYFKKAAACRIAGMPLFVTEYNHCYWNRYEYEGGIFFAAYSALQSFGGITVHQSPVMEENRPLRLENFRVATSPTKRANEFLTMSLFRRGDVQSSPHRVELLFPAEFLEKIPVEKREALLAVLADDPRPGYQKDPERKYGMSFGKWDVHFTVDGEKLKVLDINTFTD